MKIWDFGDGFEIERISSKSMGPGPQFSVL
jgi:hypothetical protein